MKSRIYTGHIMHKRYTPAHHELRYPLYFYVFDLDELEKIHKKIWYFSYNRFNIVSLHDSDYLKGNGTIKERLLDLLKDRKYRKNILRIEVLTSARYLGYIFNPVSFFFCYDRSGDILCVVAEVNNTFNERHFYVLDKKKTGTSGTITFKQEKEFHVSPFNNHEGYYEMKFSPLGSKTAIEVTLFREGGKIMTALLSGTSKELTPRNLRETILKYPFTVLLTVLRIYKEAAKLFFIKKLKYNKKPVPDAPMTISLARPKLRERAARRVINFFLRRFMVGHLTVSLPDGTIQTLGDAREKLKADISIKTNNFFWMVFKNGDIGFGEAYMHGIWHSKNVPGLLDLIIANIQHYDRKKSFLRSLSRAVKKARHPIPRNTLLGSKKNIGAHYDLGNDFFSTFLDASMLYSCAIFKNRSDTLEKAQKNKIHAVIDKACIDSKDRVLEIGSGWGGFALEAARLTGCHVTTITVSKKQYEYVTGLLKKHKMQGKITVLFKDYRHVEGQYDKIISIEMLEAIGLEYFGTFFSCCESLLKPQGVMAHQIIMLPDHRRKQYKNSHDWMRKHIFPGGMLPTLAVITRAMEKNSTFSIHDLENIGPHYARTLFEWRKKFISAGGKLNSMGYDITFRRKWLYYLMICEASFKNRIIYDAIIVFSRQYNKSLPIGPGLEYKDDVHYRTFKK